MPGLFENITGCLGIGNFKVLFQENGMTFEGIFEYYIYIYFR